jgi:hypothetical protein
VTRRRMTIGKKLIGGFLTMLAVSAVSGYLTSRIIGQVRDLAGHGLTNSTKIMDSVGALNTRMALVRFAQRGVLLYITRWWETPRKPRGSESAWTTRSGRSMPTLRNCGRWSIPTTNRNTEIRPEEESHSFEAHGHDPPIRPGEPRWDPS